MNQHQHDHTTERSDALNEQYQESETFNDDAIDWLALNHDRDNFNSELRDSVLALVGPVFIASRDYETAVEHWADQEAQ